MSRRVKILLVWLVLIAGWEAGFRIIGWKPWLFPAPSHVLDAMLHLLSIQTNFGDPTGPGWPFRSVADNVSHLTVTLPTALITSGVRLAVGFLISLFLGGMLGLLMWRFPFVDALLGPLFLGLQTLPSICWVPLAVLVIGINESSIVFVLIMGSFFAIAIALRDGLRQTPPIYKKAALMLGGRRFRLYYHVLLPAAMPAAASSLRQGFAFAWRSLMGGELVFMLPRRGVGFLLNVGREFGDVAQVVAVMCIMVAIGMMADRLIFARLELRIRTRFGLIA
ncbi:MAG TPA: ABC transporter permease subunit [Phycisphaerae bacterium]|nr:ABC transporter permease subunit [Phycisphaerae bacterium]